MQAPVEAPHILARVFPFFGRVASLPQSRLDWSLDAPPYRLVKLCKSSLVYIFPLCHGKKTPSSEAAQNRFFYRRLSIWFEERS